MTKRLLKHLFPALCAVTFSLLVIAPPGYTAAQDDDTGWTVTTVTLPLETDLVNACAGEENVHIFGQSTITTKQRLDNSGTLHIKEEIDISGTGVGAISGAEYTFDETALVHIKTDDPLPFSFVEHRSQILMGNGVPDPVFSYKIRLVINADGTVTHDVFDFKLKCKRN